VEGTGNGKDTRGEYAGSHTGPHGRSMQGE
jgi:hypothetical protein